MKKNYKAPRVRMVILDEAESLIATSIGMSKSAAQADYDGGGDSKLLNIVNMGDDEAMSWE